MRIFVGGCSRIIALAVLVFGGFVAGGRAATLTLSPGVISNLYSGTLSIQIGGLANGETVLLERFDDVNGNGVVDSGEPLVQSFRLTDGQVSTVAGIRNRNVPGDDGLSVNGQISCSIDFAHGPEFSRAAGGQIFRVSSPGSSFSPVQQVLTVNQAAAAQEITGTVSSSGTPIPYAVVATLVPSGTDYEFGTGTFADANGHFSMNVSNGMYQMIAFKPGYIGSFATSPQVMVSGANTNVTIPLTAGTATVSGTAVDAGSGAGIPGLQFFATSDNNEYCAIFSDAQGNLSVSLVAGQWKLDPSDSALAMTGYLRLQSKIRLSVSGNMSGLSFPFTKGTALIYGTVLDDQSHPLPGVRIYCSDSAGLFQSAGAADANGQFFCAVTNGNWSLGPDNASADLPAGYTLQGTNVTVGNGQAVQVTMVARRATAHLIGVAKNGNNNPISGGTILAFGMNNLNVSAQLGNDGSFNLPVSGGTWTISL
jgi:hypothetical protein